MVSSSVSHITRREVTVAVVAAVLLALLLWWVGGLVHPMVVAGGEYDGYVQNAEALLAGRLPQDHYHPLTYPLLVAAATPAVGDAFAAGRLVSALAHGLLGAVVHLALRRRLDRAASGLLALALFLHPMVLIEATHAGANATGTAFAVAAWVCFGFGGRGRMLLAGICAGAAATTRYNLLLHPVLLVLAVLAWRDRWRTLPWLLAGMVLGALPHGVLNTLQAGSPLANENWRNLPLKYAFRFDWSAMAAVPDAQLRAALARDWPAWLGQGLADAAEYWWHVAPRTLLGADLPGAGWLLTAALAVAAAVALRRRRWLALLLLGVGSVHCVAVAVAFVPVPRFCMPGLLLLLLGGAWALDWRDGAGVRWWRPLLVALALAAALWQAPRQWRAFVDAHPHGEVAAARALVAERGPVIRLAATYPYLHQQIPRCAWVGAIPTFGLRPLTAEEVCERLRRLWRDHRATLFVLGRRTESAAFAAVARATLPADFRRLHADEDVVSLEYVRADPDWRPSLQVEPDPWREGELRLTVLLDPERDPAQVAAVGVASRSPAGETTVLSLAATGPHRFELRLASGSLAPGVWRLHPTLVLRDGSLVQGIEHALTVVPAGGR